MKTILVLFVLAVFPSLAVAQETYIRNGLDSAYVTTCGPSPCVMGSGWAVTNTQIERDRPSTMFSICEVVSFAVMGTSVGQVTDAYGNIWFCNLGDATGPAVATSRPDVPPVVFSWGWRPGATRTMDIATQDRYGKSASTVGSPLVGVSTLAMYGVPIPAWLQRGTHYLAIISATNPPEGQQVRYEVSNFLPFFWGGL